MYAYNSNANNFANLLLLGSTSSAIRSLGMQSLSRRGVLGTRIHSDDVADRLRVKMAPEVLTCSRSSSGTGLTVSAPMKAVVPSAEMSRAG